MMKTEPGKLLDRESKSIALERNAKYLSKEGFVARILFSYTRDTPFSFPQPIQVLIFH